MVRVWLCGRLAADHDGRPLRMPSANRALALIGFLALHPGPQPRSVLAARLWPDVPQDSARASLRTAVWSIRQCWGPVADQVFDVSRTAIGWRPGQVWSDALDDPMEHDGELLPGVDDEWAGSARQERHERLLRGLDEAAAAALAQGRFADAVALSRRRCSAAPLDETAHRDLLHALEAAGDHAGAVIAARRFAATLRSELGVRPSPATRAVQAGHRPLTASLPPARLFGRAPHLAALTAAWRAAADGAGQVVVMTGEAGIGKTSLLAEIAHRVGAAGGRCAVGAGGDVGGETPFAAWLELARSLVTTLAPVPGAARWPVELSRLSPELGARLGQPEPPMAVAAPELERLRVFESVLRLVEWSCTDRPVLIGLDDAHSADRASLRLTAHVGRRLAGLPLLLVLTRRDRPARPDLDGLLADLYGRRVPVTELEIGPIGDDDVAALASSTHRLASEAVRRVVAAAEGNPLLAVESTRALAAGGGSPPPNLRTAVRGMLSRLPPPGQRLARLLAAAGRPLTGDELDALDFPGLPEAVEAAVDGGLLVQRDGRVGFRHELLRDVVYTDLADPGSMHLVVVGALDGGDRAELARHLALAGRTAQAAQHWTAAAAYARSVGALGEAGDFLGRAVEARPRDGQLWLQLVEVHAWAGRRELMEQAWEQTLTLLPEPDQAAAWCRRGRLLRTVVCHPEASFAAYRAAQDLLTTQTPDDVRADTLLGLAWSHAVAGDASLVDGLLERASAFLASPTDPPILADIAEIRIQGLIRQGRFAECAQVAETFHPGRAPAPLLDRAYTVWINAACALACDGQHERALTMVDRAVTATEAIPVLQVGCLAARAHLLARLGRHQEAELTLQRHRAHVDRADDPVLVATADHDAGLVALAAGHYARAARLLGTALAGRPQVSRPAAALARAEALVRAGATAEAAAQLRAAALEPVGRADQPWALVPRMAFVQGLIAAARGETALAGRRFEEAEHGWHALLTSVSRLTAEDYQAALVDLGRPPVVGLVEPRLELARVEHERAALPPHRKDEPPCPVSS
jgi:DNA-binding SARP family transcriptional activator